MQTPLRHAESPPQPLPAKQRIPTMDIVRGMALLGILIMNMPSFGTSNFAEADGSHLWPSPVDQLAEQVRDLLFSGKFNSMFSLLFGLGFTIQFQRMQQSDPARAVSLYLRRLTVLGVVGVLHACLLWTGDVLHIYAILGILLLLVLRRASDRMLVVLMALCLLYPVLSGSLRLLIVTPEMTAELVARAQAFEASNNAAYGHGSFLAAAAEHTREFAYFYSTPMTLWGSLGFYVQMLLTMLLGVLAGRRCWAERIPELMPQIRRIHLWALALGLVCGALFTVIFELQRVPGPTPLKLLGSVSYWLSRVSLMVFYVLTVVRLAQRPAWQRAFAPIACAGRMPLTNYLMQTLICTALFNGWGLGLWGRVGPAAGLALALAIYFAIQLPWSVWWLRRHETGPLEDVWKRLTYGRAASTRVRAIA
ncbi:DUF418 domain-containing protein [Ideonella sp. YS5]|uniref:DUF418 domain-containing protein n=1 Tax=Ideonella sp. YS5 TaxID=3453714 RepID=UPI003EEB580B